RRARRSFENPPPVASRVAPRAPCASRPRAASPPRRAAVRYWCLNRWPRRARSWTTLADAENGPDARRRPSAATEAYAAYAAGSGRESRAAAAPRERSRWAVLMTTRIAAIDLGTNTVRLLVADVTPRASGWRTVLAEQRVTR